MKLVYCCVIVDKVSEAIMQCFESPSDEYTMRYFGQFLDKFGKGRIKPEDFYVLVVGSVNYPETFAEVSFLASVDNAVCTDGQECLDYFDDLKSLTQEVSDESEN